MHAFALTYRPKTLDEIVGQPHLLSPESAFRRLIQTQKLSHTLLYGPPGSGKTTLARVIAKLWDIPFYEMNATSLKIESLREIFKTYHNTLERPLIFIDEIHRLSKTQQEVLLPFMEQQRAILFGASTENPYYTLTPAIRSRSHLFELKSLSTSAMRQALQRVLTRESITLEREVEAYLIQSSGGDVRAMLNLLESASSLTPTVTLSLLQEIRPTAMQAGSASATSHYDLTSAMIKSIRGSDIDASLYYLAQLIHGGEPAEFIARRLAILASEDIGNANPPALNLASSTLTIVKQIGYPEARIPLSQLVIYLASSPKSNSAYQAINDALKRLEAGEILPPPPHLTTDTTSYRYPHAYGGWVEQSYLLSPLQLYQTQKIGFEKTLWQWHQKITKKS